MKVGSSESKKSRIRDEDDGVVTWWMDVGGALDEETLAAMTWPSPVRLRDLWWCVRYEEFVPIGEGTKVCGQERKDETKVGGGKLWVIEREDPAAAHFVF